MKTSKIEYSIKKLYEMYKKGTLNFDLAIQRKNGIWDIERQSLLIHSILTYYPVPSVCVLKDKRILSFLDGKQRLTAIFDYIDNVYKTSDSVKNIDRIDIKNKSFEELPESFKNRIFEYQITVYQVENATDREIKELFYRLNNGVALKTIETTRAILGNKIISFINELTNTPFFAHKVNITKSARKRYIDQELILQILMLISIPNTGFTSKEIEAFAKTLAEKTLRTELKATMENTCYYLNGAYLKKEKFLKKVNLPMIFKLVYDIQVNKYPIYNSDFYNWSVSFFENPPEEYKSACIAGSAKKDNVQRRLRIIENNFKEHFKDKIEGFNNSDNKEYPILVNE